MSRSASKIGPKVGQAWEEVDSRRARPRRFAIVEFVEVSAFTSYAGCVRFFGLHGESLAPNPRTGRKPRRFTLNPNELDGRRFRFTGTTIAIPEGLGGYPPTKSYGL